MTGVSVMCCVVTCNVAMSVPHGCYVLQDVWKRPLVQSQVIWIHSSCC